MYPDPKAVTKGGPVTLSWEEWVKHFTTHEERGAATDLQSLEALERAKWGPCVVLGEIQKGQGHGLVNLRHCHAMGVDLEKIPTRDLIVTLKALQPFEHVLYSTHKHGFEGQVRVRMILPMAEPYAPAEHAPLWGGLNALIGGTNDPSTKNANRLYYAPSCPPGAARIAEHNRGKWIRADDLRTADGQSVVQTASLASIEARLKRIAKDHDLKPVVQALLAGEPFAEHGRRHQVILDLTWWIAERATDAPDEVIAKLFEKSILAMLHADPSSPGVADAVKGYRGAVGKITRDKESRALSEQLKRSNGKGPYTAVDLQVIAANQGWKVEDLGRKWVVQKDTSFYFLAEPGVYVGPYSAAEARLAALENLARSSVRLSEATKSGVRRLTIHEIAEDHGSTAVEVIADLASQYGRYDYTTRTLYEAPRPLRRLEPVFDQRIDVWLRAFATGQYEKLCDWLACVPFLDRILCALYLDGDSGAGKTMLPVALARLWTEGAPTELARILENFNEDLAQCPLVLADEALPKIWKGAPITAQLRTLTSTTSRTLARKFKASSTLRGTLRLVLTANNAFLLDSAGVSSSQDLDAIAQRFLYVKAPRRAAEVLESFSEDIQREWIDHDGLARHTLWLAQNRTVRRGRRFWVEGDVTQMHRMLLMTSEWNARVCEWLVRYLMTPEPFDMGHSGLIRRGEGELLVNDQAIIDGWQTYLPQTKREPETNKIGAALRAISVGRRQLRAKDGKRVRYRIIDTASLAAWSEDHNMGDPADITASVGQAPLREPGDDRDGGQESANGVPF